MKNIFSLSASSQSRSTSTASIPRSQTSSSESTASRAPAGIPVQMNPLEMPIILEIERRREQTKKLARGRGLDLCEFIRQHLIRGNKEFRYDVNDVHVLTLLALESFEAQQTLVELNGPVFVCGDIHGQYSDLMRIFHACGPPHKKRFLFLGDYVDRGRNSLEVICLLLACKVQYPEHIFMLRGNHELTHINRAYGFYDELSRRFGANQAEELWLKFNDAFSFMPLAATIGGKILGMHGGISPAMKSLEDIRALKRPIPIVIEPGLPQDLLWADPNPTKGGELFISNHFRNCSVLFSEEALKITMASLNIQLVVRAHQVAQYGYDTFCDNKMVTIFSAPRYHPEMNNWSAVANVTADLDVSFILIRPLTTNAPQK